MKQPAGPIAMFCACSAPMRLVDMRSAGVRIVCPACYRNHATPVPADPCHTEAFLDEFGGDLPDRWGWQCSCSEEGDGYRTLAAAETAGLAHEAGAA